MYRIRCHTLFDITQTGVLNRSKPTGEEVKFWVERRNTQCNFDTILQVISLRSQPDVCKLPTKIKMESRDLDRFGFLYRPKEGQESYCWHFDFEIQHPSVFENGIKPLGALYKDCEGVPMILCEDQLDTPAFLDVTEELRNIYFEVI